MGRLFGFLSVIVVLGVGMYFYAMQVRNPSTAAGANNPKAAVNLAGVKADLIGIATAERRYNATEGKYGSLDDLVAGGYLSISRQRPPYSYEVQTSESGFRVVATRSGDDGSGTPAQLAVDETMEFQTSQ